MGQLTQTTNEVQQILDTVVTNPMTAQGDLIVGGTGGIPSRLAKGTIGQVLVTNSTNTGVEWGTPGGGGGGGTIVELTCSEWPIGGMSSATWSFTDPNMTTANLYSLIKNDGETVIISFTATRGSETCTFYLPVTNIGFESSGGYINIAAYGIYKQDSMTLYYLTLNIGGQSGSSDSFYLNTQQYQPYSSS